MAARRLEFPEEFILFDGSRLKTPAELADRLAETPEIADEVTRRLAEGEVERWLLETGWVPIAQQVAGLRQRPKSIQLSTMIEALQGRRPAAPPPAPPPPPPSESPTPAQGEVEPEPSATAAAVAGGLPAGSEQADLLKRQSRALTSLLRFEDERRQAEEREATRIQREESGARRRAREERSVADSLIEEARQEADRARRLLDEAGLPRAPAGTEASGPGSGLGGEARRIRSLAGTVIASVGSLAALRDSLSRRRTFLFQAAAVLAAVVVAILVALWASRNARLAAEAGSVGAVPVQEAPEDIAGRAGSGATDPVPGGSGAPSLEGDSPGARSTVPSATEPTASLEIRTNVVDDLVLLDGEPLGPSPQFVDVGVGLHVVEARKPGCVSARTQLSVRADERREVRLTVSCTTAQDYVDRARRHFEAGEYDRALTEIDRALALSPGFAPALELGERVRATRAILEGGSADEV